MYISIYLYTFKDTVKFSKDPCSFAGYRLLVEVSKRSSAYAKTPGVYLGKSTRTSRRCFRRGNGHRQLSQISFYMRRLEHRMKLTHSQIFLNRSRCLFMEGMKTTLLIIKLEHTTVLYRKLVLKQFGTSMMM